MLNFFFRSAASGHLFLAVVPSRSLATSPLQRALAGVKQGMHATLLYQSLQACTIACCVLQQTPGHYFWLGQYDRQVASTINYSLKGDGRLYGIYLKSDSYFEGIETDEIWQACVETKCAPPVKCTPTPGGF